MLAYKGPLESYLLSRQQKGILLALNFKWSFGERPLELLHDKT